MVFIDEQENSIRAGDYLWWNQDVNRWGGMPTDRHGQAGVLGHADGHAQVHRWREPKRDRPLFDTVRAKNDIQDFKFMTSGRPREFDYAPKWWN